MSNQLPSNQKTFCVVPFLVFHFLAKVVYENVCVFITFSIRHILRVLDVNTSPILKVSMIPMMG